MYQIGWFLSDPDGRAPQDDVDHHHFLWSRSLLRWCGVDGMNGNAICTLSSSSIDPGMRERRPRMTLQGGAGGLTVGLVD